ncbi:uncharacterized protein EI97DRAFT_484051 [Westerdykella ornata]|uniref:Glucose-methanol-choline oxidoreductase N-terminal domain-containing protein n=1 Tax=Westerdykella ornata TaxID=318751 RepID=A0A6A6JB14_WESOR|nr:uncharacterized protein EI97DRAFT_484051 [Westerdykella ornata]KAF2272389.1 hypothetical protein EI97DRAFT_484051 [Westerdykella ornata]
MTTTTTTEKMIAVLEAARQKKPRAIGVQPTLNGSPVTMYARREIVLSAGVFASPKLLELSGIGDPAILSRHGIPVRVANPYVGTNLQDHILCSVSFEAADGGSTGRRRRDRWQRAGVRRLGYLPTLDFAENPGELGRALEMLDNDATTVPKHPLDSARRSILRNFLEKAEEGTGQYLVLPAQSRAPGRDTTVNTIGADPQPGNFVSIVTALSHPLSTGESHISSADPSAHPTINHNYLLHPLDLELHARHALTLERIAATEPFASSVLKPNGRRHHPSAFLDGGLAKAKEYVKAASTTNWHSVGTCSMAPREKGGVVDADLRVYGVEGLRVVDARVVPFVPQSNTQSLVYAVAERAAEIILGEV